MTYLKKFTYVCVSLLITLFLFGCPEKKASDNGAPAAAVNSEAAAISSDYAAKTKRATDAVKAADFSLPDLKGGKINLADYKGKIVILDFWATWCPPCKAEMPTLVRFHRDHSSDGLTIVAIEAGEPREQVLQYVKEYGMTFTVWLDPTAQAMTAFRNQNLPSSYVLDRDGNVRYAWTGEISREMLDKYVVPLLSE